MSSSSKNSLVSNGDNLGKSHDQLIEESINNLKQTISLLESELQRPVVNKQTVKVVTTKLKTQLETPISNEESVKAATNKLQSELEKEEVNPGNNLESLKIASANLQNELSRVVKEPVPSVPVLASTPVVANLQNELAILNANSF